MLVEVIWKIAKRVYIGLRSFVSFSVLVLLFSRLLVTFGLAASAGLSCSSEE